MGSPAVADREAMLAALAQIEELTAQMNGLSIDAFTDAELLALQQRRSDHRIEARRKAGPGDGPPAGEVSQ